MCILSSCSSLRASYRSPGSCDCFGDVLSCFGVLWGEPSRCLKPAAPQHGTALLLPGLAGCRSTTSCEPFSWVHLEPAAPTGGICCLRWHRRVGAGGWGGVSLPPGVGLMRVLGGGKQQPPSTPQPHFPPSTHGGAGKSRAQAPPLF